VIEAVRVQIKINRVMTLVISATLTDWWKRWSMTTRLD